MQILFEIYLSLCKSVTKIFLIIWIAYKSYFCVNYPPRVIRFYKMYILYLSLFFAVNFAYLPLSHQFCLPLSLSSIPPASLFVSSIFLNSVCVVNFSRFCLSFLYCSKNHASLYLILTFVLIQKTSFLESDFCPQRASLSY